MNEPLRPDHTPADEPSGEPAKPDRSVSAAESPTVGGPSVPASALDQRLGITYLETTPDRVVATMPVEGNTQPFGLLHGGASCVLAESLGSVAASLHALPDAVPVGVDINATHHRAVRTGVVTGVATPAHRGRSSASYEIVITDEAGHRVCTARITCFLRPVSGGAGSLPSGIGLDTGAP